MRKGIVLLLLVLTLIPTVVYSAPPSINPRPIDEESYGESYTAVALLENGTYILLQLLFTNAGFGSEKPACRGLVVPPSGKAWNHAERGDRDDWKFSKGKNQITAMNCSFRAGAADTEFRVKMDGRTVILRSPTAIARHFPPKRRIVLEEGMFEAEVLLRWEPLKATISGPGMAGAEGVGKIYIDHTRSNAMMKDVADVWLRFRGFFGEKRMLFQARLPAGKKSYRGWTWVEGEAKPTPFKSGELKRNKRKSQDGFVLKASGRGGQVVSKKLLFTYKPVEEYGMLGSLAKSIVGDPVIRTYRAVWTGEDGKQIEGVLETMDLGD